MIMLTWEDIGVTPAKQRQFESRGIYTVSDLTSYFPRAYKDFTVITGLQPYFEVVTAIVTVEHIKIKNELGKTPSLCAICTEKDTGKRLNVFWFHQNYLYHTLNDLCGKTVFVAGKLSETNNEKFFLMSMPTIFEEYSDNMRRIVPVYKKVKGMSFDYLTGKIKEAFMLDPNMDENVPRKYLDRYHLPSLHDALILLHFPQNVDEIRRGRARIVFDDLLFYALGNELMIREASLTSDKAIRAGEGFQKTIEQFPFQLTQDQDTTVKEMLRIIESGNRLNALLQGDVGCGKTVVAFLLMMAAADSGYQSVLMAPTQILADQHYQELLGLCEKTGYRAVFLGAGMKKKERASALEAIRDGRVQFIVGTHAVLTDDIEFNALGLMIVDEEHKFGVKQRSAVINRAKNGVHSVTMSATPIPRSFADALYGNHVRLFNIVSKPFGRKDIETTLELTIDGMCKKITDEVKLGHQAYIVCPLIDESDKETMKDVHSVEQVSRECGKYFAANGVRYGVLTGKDKKEAAALTISDFKSGALDVLIATSVIEVGVNVPNATVMAVTSAERFGLSSLHQLRGRVGRSDLQSYCILQSDKGMGNERLSAMIKEHDGFKIAEADLKIRGAGDFLGTDQSGNYNNYVELAMRYPDSYKRVQGVAKEILDNGEDYGKMEVLCDRITQAVS